MTPKQKRTLRLAVLRALLHPRSSVADMLDGVPDGDLRDCCNVVTETLIARLEFLLLARNARFERATKRKFAL